MEVFGCDFDPKRKELQAREAGDLPDFSLPLFARFKLETESSALTCELLTIAPRCESPNFSNSEELKSTRAERESLYKDYEVDNCKLHTACLSQTVALEMSGSHYDTATLVP